MDTWYLLHGAEHSDALRAKAKGLVQPHSLIFGDIRDGNINDLIDGDPEFLGSGCLMHDPDSQKYPVHEELCMDAIHVAYFLLTYSSYHHDEQRHVVQQILTPGVTSAVERFRAYAGQCYTPIEKLLECHTGHLQSASVVLAVETLDAMYFLDIISHTPGGSFGTTAWPT